MAKVFYVEANASGYAYGSTRSGPYRSRDAAERASVAILGRLITAPGIAPRVSIHAEESDDDTE